MTKKDTDMEIIENESKAGILPLTPDKMLNLPQMTIGEFIRNAREEKDFSLKKISRHTKISVSLLELLENDKLEELPNKAYVIGFIKSLSSVISFDKEEAIKLCDHTYDVIRPEMKRLKVDVLKETDIEPNQSPAILIAVVMVFFLIGVTAFFYNSSKAKKVKIVQTQFLNSDAPLKKPSASFKVESTMKEIAANEIAQTEETTKVEKKEVNLATMEEEAKEDPVAVKAQKDIKEEKESAELKLRQLPSKLYSINKETTDESLKKHVPLSMQNSVIAGKQNLFITAVDGDSWITYKKDNDPVKKFTLTKGKNLLIRGDLIRVFMGNLQASKLFLNNELLDITTKSGVKSLVFPETEAKSYKLPLFIFKKNGDVVPSDEYDVSNDI